ncbi:ABC transporter ATP-binding protein [Photobacterium sp. TY1-4]|uniref:ABC transporter ATP-binding protein n=1 Tax=Photobacterium sp. TY1-4 TaxID=2899122 RepID=UPI0021BF7B12|nr:ABC transporter ATP-binding protein [Photobacterium sp. TY1-4]UXI03426.1 ABC transporter ATP-binding protein [Photobacterium sp. TY1-4]
MTSLNIQGLCAGYGDKQILSDINLTVHQGEMIALLGPSGCGKTTLLNALCGFLPVSEGEIRFGDRNMTNLPAEKRNITMVFQSYALWPHMTVAQNIGYGLKVRKVPAQQIAQRIDEFLAIVNLAGLKDQKVTDLSGGQRQRVALARALAIRPDILVLDEPLSNLDAKVRLQVRHEIKSLQKQFGFTSLIVTHDQEEALVMADRIAVLNQGKIEQLGTSEEVYHQPKTPFVADFMGADNRIIWPENSKELQIYFRSEKAQLVEQHCETPCRSLSEEDGLQLSGRVLQSAFFGHNYRVSVECEGQLIQAVHPTPLEPELNVLLRVPHHSLHMYHGQH